MLLRFLALSLAALAQTAGVSSVSGRVADPSNAPLPGAAVTLVRPAGAPLSTTTNSAGQYLFAAIPPGEYDLQVDAPGFARTTITGLRAGLTRTLVQDVRLDLATRHAEVEVNAAPPLDTADSSIGQTLPGAVVRRIPSAFRDASLVFRYQPAVHQNGETSGARADQNSIFLDGADVSSGYGAPFTPNILLPAETVEEVRVVVANPIASLTRGSGAQFTVETRSGANAFHGALYSYLQNDALNANSWLNNRLAIRRPAYRDIRPGATAGGPLRKDRTFFFSAFELRRRSFGQTFNVIVPTASLRQGRLRFRDSAGETRTVDPRDFDPRGLGANPAILGILNRFPEPNNATGFGDGLNTSAYTFTAPIPVQSGYGLTRLDHDFSPRWRLNTSGRLTQGDSAGGGQLNVETRQPLRYTNNYARFFTVALTGTPRPNLSTRLQATFLHDRWGGGGQPPPAFAPLNLGADLGATLLGDLVTAGGPARWQRGRANSLSLSGQIDYQRASHQFQAGLSFRRVAAIDIRNNKFASAFTSPIAQIGAAAQVAVPAASRPAFLRPADIRPYNVLYSTLLGIVDSVSVLRVRDGRLDPLETGTPLSGRVRFFQIESFAQDVWRVSPSLTLTLGLAYGAAPPAVEADRRQVIPVLAATGEPIDPQRYLTQKRTAAEAGRAYNPAFAFQPVSALGRDSVYDADWRNLSPRVSAAWAPGSRRTVFRGGYGLLYDRTTITSVLNVPAFGLGFGQSYVLSPRNPAGQPFRAGIDGPIPVPAAPRLSAPIVPDTASPESLSTALDPALRTPRSHLFNFSIQRHLPWQSVLEVAYTGRLGRRLYQHVNLNSFPYMFRDPASGQSFAQAFDAVATQLRSGIAPAAIAPQPWFENMVRPGGTRTVAADRAEDIALGNLSNFAQFYLNGQLRAPIQNAQIADMLFMRSDGRSNYNGAIVTWNKRLSSGLQVTANYTYSKSLDQYGNFQDDPTYATDSYNREVNYGPSLFDHRHLFSSLFYYDLPRHARGWWLSGIFFANSGEPYDVVGGAQSFGGGTLYPYSAAALPLAAPQFDNQVHRTSGSDGIGTALGTGLNRFADPAAVYRNFRFPNLASDGRTGRGAIRDYVNWNLDLAVGKKTHITERLSVSFSFEFLNALNRVIFFNPSVDLTNPTQFGVLSRQWNSPRIAQAGLRTEW